MYVILTGRWPYRDVPGRPEWDSEREGYETLVEERFSREEYPDVTALSAGNVIMGCWKRQYGSAQEVVDALMEICGRP